MADGTRMAFYSPCYAGCREAATPDKVWITVVLGWFESDTIGYGSFEPDESLIEKMGNCCRGTTTARACRWTSGAGGRSRWATARASAQVRCLRESVGDHGGKGGTVGGPGSVCDHLIRAEITVAAGLQACSASSCCSRRWRSARSPWACRSSSSC